MQIHIPYCNFTVSGDHENQIERLSELSTKLKEKHGTDPVILFIDENDISMGKFSTDFRLKNLEDLNIISAISPIVEKDYVRRKDNGFDFNEQDIFIEDKKCLWINLNLRYRNSSSIQNFCRNVGHSLRKVPYLIFYFYLTSIFPQMLLCLYSQGRISHHCSW